MHAAVLVYKNVDKCKSDGATVQINKRQQTIITSPPELKMTSACMDSEAALASHENEMEPKINRLILPAQIYWGRWLISK